MQVTPATSAMPQDRRAVWGQCRRCNSSPLHLSEKTNLFGLYLRKPEVTDSKLCALFHSTKVWVGSSHGPIVAKDPDDNWVSWDFINRSPTYRQPELRCDPKRCRRRVVHRGKHFPRTECLQSRRMSVAKLFSLSELVAMKQKCPPFLVQGQHLKEKRSLHSNVICFLRQRVLLESCHSKSKSFTNPL